MATKVGLCALLFLIALLSLTGGHRPKSQDDDSDFSQDRVERQANSPLSKAIKANIDELVRLTISESLADIIKDTVASIQAGLIEEKGERVLLQALAEDIKTRQDKLEDDQKNTKERQDSLTKTIKTRQDMLEDDQKNTKERQDSLTKTIKNRIDVLENNQKALKAEDCWDLLTVNKITKDGVYEVFTRNGQRRSLRCDMTTDGGGWTVFQRRGDGSVSFNRNWAAYRSLFGQLTGEFWMGNEFLYEMTRAGEQTLRVDLCDWDGQTRWAKYRGFSVGSAQDKYTLRFHGYTGTAGDALYFGGESRENHNGSAFSTPDQDNDRSSGDNCAATYYSGWWHNSCGVARLNGLYRQEDTSDNTWYGIQWYTWIERHSYRGSEMKLRPLTATPLSTTTLQSFSCPVI